MTVRPIVAVGVPVLRQKAKRISQFDRYLQQLVQDMLDTMRDRLSRGREEEGVDGVVSEVTPQRYCL